MDSDTRWYVVATKKGARVYKESGLKKIMVDKIAHGNEQRKRMRAKTFARQIAANLEAARRKNLFVDLILVAEPRFMGVLLRELDPTTKGYVRFEIKVM